MIPKLPRDKIYIKIAYNLTSNVTSLYPYLLGIPKPGYVLVKTNNSYSFISFCMPEESAVCTVDKKELTCLPYYTNYAYL